MTHPRQDKRVKEYLEEARQLLSDMTQKDIRVD